MWWNGRWYHYQFGMLRRLHTSLKWISTMQIHVYSNSSPIEIYKIWNIKFEPGKGRWNHADNDVFRKKGFLKVVYVLYCLLNIYIGCSRIRPSPIIGSFKVQYSVMWHAVYLSKAVYRLRQTLWGRIDDQIWVGSWDKILCHIFTRYCPLSLFLYSYSCSHVTILYSYSSDVVVTSLNESGRFRLTLLLSA
jgi:hypothetical protein